MKPLTVVLLLAIPVSFGQVTKKPSIPKTQHSAVEVKFSLCDTTITLGQTQGEVLKALTPVCTISDTSVEKMLPVAGVVWLLL
jgi:hypothetical protein